VIRNPFFSYLKQISSLLPSFYKIIFVFFSLIAFSIILLVSCSPAKRFPEKDEKTVTSKEETKSPETSTDEEEELNNDFSEIRVSLQGQVSSETLQLQSPTVLYKEKNKLVTLDSGSSIECYYTPDNIKLVTDNDNFVGDKFTLLSTGNDGIIKLNGKHYRGRIQISQSGYSIDIINIVKLEDYVKGVLAKEMPIGKNEENLEALKALAICIRTYAVKKMKDGKVHFDIYADTRDQVYGGVDAEQPITNKAADETKNRILNYDGLPATVFYHSTCGGYTESSDNVFTKIEIPYLISVEDGNGPNCKISPRFEWEEKYTRETIVDRLISYSLLSNRNYTLYNITVNSKFKSGRVNELEFTLIDEHDEEILITINGNEIRSVLRTSDNKNILWSTMFDVSINSNQVILSGRGFGHGVGLCQWGAIALSQDGQNYTEILQHYYPGTETGFIND